jgi:hypothetical protein
MALCPLLLALPTLGALFYSEEVALLVVFIRVISILHFGDTKLTSRQRGYNALYTSKHQITFLSFC